MAAPSSQSPRAILLYPLVVAGGWLPEPALIARALERLHAAYPAAPMYVGAPNHPGAEAAWQAVESALALSGRQQVTLSAAVRPLVSKPESGEDTSLIAALRAISTSLREGAAGDTDTNIEFSDSIAICRGWFALFDVALSAELLADHARYLAHISYSETIPPGMLPDFVSLEFVDALADPLPAELSHGTGGGDLRAFAFKNIDRFDVELFYRSPDLRQHRLDFSLNTPRSAHAVRALLNADAECDFARLPEALARPEVGVAVMRPYPAYFEVELTSCYGDPAFAPVFWPARPAGSAEHLAAPLATRLLDDIESSGLPDDATIALGGAGDPLLYPDLVAFAERALALRNLKELIIESYGVGVPADLFAQLCALPGAERLRLIVRLDTLKGERYAELYGVDRLAEVVAFLQSSTAAVAAVRRAGDAGAPEIFVEMQRLAQNEDELSEFMDRFEVMEDVQPLLRKYNRLIDRLPERRAADLTPLTRDFCWHLARDFYLNVDGQVPLCKQDPFAESAGALHFAEHSVAEILERTRPTLAASLAGKHAETGMPCLQCDEWYTCNA